MLAQIFLFFEYATSARVPIAQKNPKIFRLAFFFEQKSGRTSLIQNVNGAIERLILMPIARFAHLAPIQTGSSHSCNKVDFFFSSIKKYNFTIIVIIVQFFVLLQRFILLQSGIEQIVGVGFAFAILLRPATI